MLKCGLTTVDPTDVMIVVGIGGEENEFQLSPTVIKNRVVFLGHMRYIGHWIVISVANIPHMPLQYFK